MTYVPSAEFGKGFEGWYYGNKMGPFGDWPFYASITKALEKQPKMQIMVGGGYFDTQTSIGAAEYLLKQAGWPKQNTRLARYEGGHMCYSNAAAQVKLCNDLRDFLRSAG
jgi:carboxypeptidase C (cathepsin A)